MCAVKALVCSAGYIWSQTLPLNLTTSTLILNHAGWMKRKPISSIKMIPLDTFLFVCLFVYSLFQRSCRTDQGSAMWWLSVLMVPRAGCRQPCRPRRHPDMFLKMRASSLSRLSTSKSEFTTTRGKARLDRLPPSILLRKVCNGWHCFPYAKRNRC